MRNDKQQIRNYEPDTKREEEEGSKKEKKKGKSCLLVPGASGCAGVEERLAVLDQSVLLQERVARHGGAGFGVSMSCLHWRLLFCSPKSHGVGVGGEMVSPQFLLPGLGISTHTTQAALTEQ